MLSLVFTCTFNEYLKHSFKEFRSTSVEFRLRAVEFRSAAVEFKSAAVELRSTAVEFTSIAVEFRLTVVNSTRVELNLRMGFLTNCLRGNTLSAHSVGSN